MNMNTLERKLEMNDFFTKVKEFFEKKAVIITESIIMALCSAGLFIGGVNAEEAAKTIALDVGGVLLALETLITFIQGLKKKSE